MCTFLWHIASHFAAPVLGLSLQALISLLRDEFPGCCLTFEPAGSIKATVGDSPVHLEIKLSGTFPGLGGASTHFAALSPEARHVWRPSLGEWQVDFFRESARTAEASGEPHKRNFYIVTELCEEENQCSDKYGTCPASVLWRH